jgi:hypothetical protein
MTAGPFYRKMKKIREILKSIKKTIKVLWKKGILAKILIIISSLALLATSVLPYIVG